MDYSENNNEISEPRLTRGDLIKKCVLGGASFFHGFVDGFNPEGMDIGPIMPLLNACIDGTKISEISSEETDKPKLEFNPRYRATNFAFKIISHYSLYLAGQQAGQLTRNLR